VHVLDLPFDVAQKHIVEFRRTLHGNGEPDDEGLSRVEICLHLVGRKGSAMPVVSGRHLVHRLDFANAFQPLFLAASVIGRSLFHERERVFLIQIEALALNVGGVLSAAGTALVPFKAEPCESVV